MPVLIIGVLLFKGSEKRLNKTDAPVLGLEDNTAPSFSGVLTQAAAFSHYLQLKC